MFMQRNAPWESFTVEEAPKECLSISSQDGPTARPQSAGVQTLWKEHPQVFQDEPRRLHSDWAPAGVLSVRRCAHGIVPF